MELCVVMDWLWICSNNKHKNYYCGQLIIIDISTYLCYTYLLYISSLQEESINKQTEILNKCRHKRSHQFCLKSPSLFDSLIFIKYISTLHIYTYLLYINNSCLLYDQPFLLSYVIIFGSSGSSEDKKCYPLDLNV